MKLLPKDLWGLWAAACAPSFEKALHSSTTGEMTAAIMEILRLPSLLLPDQVENEKNLNQRGRRGALQYRLESAAAGKLEDDIEEESPDLEQHEQTQQDDHGDLLGTLDQLEQWEFRRKKIGRGPKKAETETLRRIRRSQIVRCYEQALGIMNA